MKTQIVVMAAGIGSRFGDGIKQLTKVGPNGEVIMEYSIRAAKNAGFDEAVIILRKDIKDEFKKVIGDRLSKIMPCKYAFQEMDNLPLGFSAPSDRIKPYGTAHALYCTKSFVDSPFVVVNADDYYGVEGFDKIHNYLVGDRRKDIFDMCMAGYIIGNTLSKNGTVTRGVCEKDENDFLTKVNETYEISEKEDGKIRGIDENKKEIVIDKNSLVSMNMFGLPYEFLDILEEKFIDFLNKNNDNIKSEFLLPKVINKLIEEKKGCVKVLRVSDVWYGVTYASDKNMVIEALKNIKI